MFVLLVPCCYVCVFGGIFHKASQIQEAMENIEKDERDKKKFS